MAGNNITEEAAPAVAACLATNRHLKKLNLSENDLKERNVLRLYKEYVDISYKDLRIGGGGALSLAHVVVKKENFKISNIEGNMISVKAIEEVKEIYKNCPKLLGPLEER